MVFFDLGDTLIGAGRTWIPGADACLSRLHAARLRVGVVSNTWSLTRAEVEALMPDGLRFDRFDASLILLSSVEAVAKPDPEIFERAVERAAVPASETVFVGENLVEAWVAQSVGMRAVRLAETPADFERLIELLS